MTTLAVSVDWGHIAALAAFYFVGVPILCAFWACVILAADRRSRTHGPVAPVVDLDQARVERRASRKRVGVSTLARCLLVLRAEHSQITDQPAAERRVLRQERAAHAALYRRTGAVTAAPINPPIKETRTA